MAKKKTTKKKVTSGTLFDDSEKIVQELRFGRGHVLVILIIPSHDKKNKPLSDQAAWVDRGMTLLGSLFGGATAFQARKGIFIPKNKQPIYDEPYLLESYAPVEAVEDMDNMMDLMKFIKRVGQETNQDCMGVVIDDTLHLIDDYRE